MVAESAAAPEIAAAVPTPLPAESSAGAEMPPIPESTRPLRRRHPQAPAADRRRIVYEPPVKRWRPWVAGCMSLVMPGLGQLYKRQFLNAIAWFALVAVGYAALVVPGIILHLCCILGALSGDPWTKGRTIWVDDGTDRKRD